MFNKVLSPCLWLSSKLPLNSNRKKYPSKPIQFLKLQPFKFMGPYYSYLFLFHIEIIQYKKGKVIPWVLFSFLAHSEGFIQPAIAPNRGNKCSSSHIWILSLRILPLSLMLHPSLLFVSVINMTLWMKWLNCISLRYTYKGCYTGNLRLLHEKFHSAMQM